MESEEVKVKRKGGLDVRRMMMRMLHEWPALSAASTGCNNSTGSAEEEEEREGREAVTD